MNPKPTRTTTPRKKTAASKPELLHHFPEGECKNGHDTAQSGRYRSTNQCVQCVKNRSAARRKTKAQ